jgi:hypothetical protein
VWGQTSARGLAAFLAASATKPAGSVGVMTRATVSMDRRHGKDGRTVALQSIMKAYVNAHPLMRTTRTDRGQCLSRLKAVAAPSGSLLHGDEGVAEKADKVPSNEPVPTCMLRPSALD